MAKHSESQKEEGVKPNFQSEIQKGQEQRSESEVCSPALEGRMTGWKKHTLLTTILLRLFNGRLCSGKGNSKAV